MQKTLKNTFSTLCCVAFLASGGTQATVPVPASPGGVSVSPTSLVINVGNSNSTSAQVVNTGTAPVLMEAELQRWTQENGRNVFTPTRDVTVNPARFTLEAGATQIMRIGFRTPPGKQQAYRLLVRQTTPNIVDNIRIVLQFNLAVIVARPGDEAKIRVETSCTPDGRKVTFFNDGSGRQLYSKVSAEFMEQTLKLPTRTVLAGGAQDYQLPIPATWAGDLVLNYLDQLERPQREIVRLPGC